MLSPTVMNCMVTELVRVQDKEHSKIEQFGSYSTLINALVDVSW